MNRSSQAFDANGAVHQGDLQFEAAPVWQPDVEDDAARRIGLDRGLVIGLLAGFRNLGLVMAAIGSTLPPLAWFFFALVQFPIYLLPALLKPLASRLHRPPAH